jgi:DsbC/DsbD-like thiol-disulfide interchange protein
LPSSEPYHYRITWVTKAKISALDRNKLQRNLSLASTILRKIRLPHRDPMLAQTRVFGHLLFVNRACLGLALCLSTLPAKSDPFASPWSGQEGDKAQMRLIAATFGENTYKVAAEIKLPSSAITYWRDPGDAGVPPKFSVNGSENVAAANILFPAPYRLDDQGIEAYGYRGSVIFPIHVAARDTAAPVYLRLTMNYAVCDKICLPVESSAGLLLPKLGDGPEAAEIAAAEARVPHLLAPKDVAEKVTLRPDEAATTPTWLLTWRGDLSPIDLFAEAPEGWAFETHRQPDGVFSIALVEHPLTGGAPHVPVRLTLTGLNKAYEFTIELQIPSKPVPIASPRDQTMQATPSIGTK